MPDPVRISITEAANILGTSQDAVRKRIKRGTLEAEKDGHVWKVLCDPDTMQPVSKTKEVDDSHYWELINQLKAEHKADRQRYEERIIQLEAEKEELRADKQLLNSHISMLIERVPPAIEAEVQNPSQSEKRPHSFWQSLLNRFGR